MSAVTLLIPAPTPSPNLTRWKHWRAVKKERDTWKTLVAVALLALPERPTAAYDKRSVRVLRVGKRLLDPDNLYSSVKVLLDALADQRLLVMDSGEWLTLIVSQRKTTRGEAPHTQVVIEDDPNPMEGSHDQKTVQVA